MDAVTALHFTTATAVGDERIDETIAVGTRGGLLVGYKLSDNTIEHVRFPPALWYLALIILQNAHEVYCAKYSDYPLVAITSVSYFILIVTGIQPSFHHGGQFCLRLYTLDGPQDPSLKLDPIWKRRMTGGQPKMVSMYFEKTLESPTVDLWLHSGIQ